MEWFEDWLQRTIERIAAWLEDKRCFARDAMAMGTGLSRCAYCAKCDSAKRATHKAR